LKKITKSTRRRLKFTLFIVTLIVFFLTYRLIKIQIVDAEKLKTGALQQWTKSIDIKTDRGIIYDTKGRKLAVNVTAFTLWATPSEIKDPEEVARELSSVLDMSYDDIYAKLIKDVHVEKIQQWITREVADTIREKNLRGISIVDDNKRFYPFGSFAAYILGFTDIDNNGLYGIEKSYDKYLTGIPGTWVKATDAANRQLPYDGEKVFEPDNGKSVVLSVDETIQYFAEVAATEALINNNAKSVSIIVMDPHTGDILALANKPDYNPNTPRESLDPETNNLWSQLTQEERQNRWFEMWRNYAINDIYEPGSTFKIITAAATLEEATSNLNSTYYCDGYIRDIKGVVLRCASWYDPHEHQDFSEAFANSCNVAFVNMARELGRDKLYEYIKAFGFGELTGVDLPGEQKGIIPVSSQNIREVNLATLSYGHGIAVTPIQMINAISVTANGGKLMTPRFVKSILDENDRIIENFPPEVKRQVISETTAKELLGMLEKTVIEGTGRKAYVPGYRVGGKTGTAQKIIDGRYVPNKYISSFGGVAPVDDPKISVLVIVDEPTGIYYGGTVAGPYAQMVIENTLNYLEVPRVYTEEELENISEVVIVPDVSGLKIPQAGEEITALGLKYTTEYEIFTNESIVLDQYPLAGSEVTKGSIIDLYLDYGESNPNLSTETEEEN